MFMTWFRITVTYEIKKFLKDASYQLTFLLIIEQTVGQANLDKY